jgi:hypothetical protein
MAGAQEDFDRVRYRLALIKKGLRKVAGFPKKLLSPESLAARLASPFFLVPATTYPHVLTLAQQTKSNAAPRPLALLRASFMQRRIEPVTPFITPLSVLAAPSGGAAAEEGQDAVNALDMDCCSFDSSRTASNYWMA